MLNDEHVLEEERKSSNVDSPRMHLSYDERSPISYIFFQALLRDNMKS